MPKLSEQTWATRRRNVLESAFRCFARSGFHATTIDDVVAESGLSSSVVYRYARTKDELVSASIEEARTLLSGVVEGLVAQDPVPTPEAAVRAVVDLLDDERNERPYNLAGLVIQSWAEALRTPDLGDRARDQWAEIRRLYVRLARRWKKAGRLPEGMSPDDAAGILMVLNSGLVVDQAHFGAVSTPRVLRRLAAHGL